MGERKTILLALVLAAFGFVGGRVAVHAQDFSATLTGTVVDEKGAVIAAAKITVVNVATGLRRDASTNADGSFTIPLLPPGIYTVTAEHEGFATVETRDVTLNVNDQRSLQIQLKVGAVNTNVTVTGEADTIREDPAVATVVDRQFVENMPLNGRSLQSLIALTPGSVFVKVDTNPIAGGQFSINGQRADANYFTVDGVSANFSISTGTGSFSGQSAAGSLPGLTALGGTNSMVSIDALQEFKIQTSTYAPEFGRTPGGQISLITRSGTNGFHGDGFDYLRNSVMDANNWFADNEGLPKPAERQNDFGGVIGGPIKRDKLFFFFSYEGQRIGQPVTAEAAVPTLQARQQAAPVVQPFFNAFPLPNGAVVGTGLQNFDASFTNPANLNAYSIRMDYAASQNLNFFGVYKNSPSEQDARTGALNLIQSDKFSNESATLGGTWAISANKTNELRFNWAKVRSTEATTIDSFGGATVPSDQILGVTPLNPANEFFFWSVFNGASTAGFQLVGTGNDNIEYQTNLVDTFTWVKGAHDFKFGVDYRRINPILNRAGGNFQGAYFNIASDASLFLAQLSVGGTENKVLFQNFSTFAQDTWKASQRLTVTYGVRWDVNPSPSSENGKNPAVLGPMVPGQPATLLPYGTPIYNTKYANIAPRVGVAYQLRTESGHETMLRAGAGVFYDTGAGVLATVFDHIYPYFASTAIYGIKWPLTGANAKLPVLGVDPPQQLWSAIPNLQLPYSVQYNVSIEQALGHAQSLTVSYIGSVGRRQLYLYTSETEVAGFGATQIPFYQTTNQSYSNYNALQVQFQRRLARGIQGTFAYTYSRSMDTASGDDVAQAPPADLGPQSVYAPSDFDVRHSLSGAITINLPAVERSRVANAITRDWGLDALVRYRTALPTDVTTFTSVDGISIQSRPNIVPGQPLYLIGSQYPGGKEINQAALAAPATNQIGDLPRNFYRFFNASQVDFGLRRQFSLTERFKLQFKAEFFNLFNHPNFADPNGSEFNANWFVSTQTLASGLGGLNPLYQIGGPRSGQVSLKFIF